MRSRRCSAGWPSISACGATASRPLLFVCEEAHRYAPADVTLGFGPTRRALSRIAKEGRKYGVYLGLVSQRPSEIDPTIISQCSTLFVMRLSNDRDQAFIRSAVVRRGRQPAVVHSFARDARGVHVRRRDRAADADAVQRIARRDAPQQRGRRQHPIASRGERQPGHDQVGDRAVAQREHELQGHGGARCRRRRAGAARGSPLACPHYTSGALSFTAPAAPADPRRQALLRKPLEASMPSGTLAGFTRPR